jgi:two-component system, NtrC family, response regulator AtoC
VFPMRLPPLKERPGDIGPLSASLLSRIGRQLGRPGLSLEETALARLRRYHWPGNVRELANVLERAAILCDGRSITGEHLGLEPGGASAREEGPALDGSLADLEREAIRRALTATGGHRRQAAERLGIGLRTLYDKLRVYGIE